MAKAKKTKRLPPKNLNLTCPFAGPHEISYKDVYNLKKKFITTRGRIRPSSTTGVCPKCQRKLSLEIKRARQLALLPYTHYT